MSLRWWEKSSLYFEGAKKKAAAAAAADKLDRDETIWEEEGMPLEWIHARNEGGGEK